MVGFGDGFDTRPDLAEPDIAYALWQGGNLGRVNVPRGEWRDIKPSPPDGVKLRFNWNAGLATDPFKPGTIYLGSQFLHKSTDRGETWTTISPDLTSNNPEWQRQDETGGLTPDASGAENFTTIIAIAPSSKQEGVIWVGTDDGRLHVTRDGGKTWTSVEKNVPGVPANTWIPHITPSRHDPATGFVVFDNHRRSDFATYAYRTDDWGKTWKSLVTKDLRGYAHILEQDPVEKNLLFLGTESGLWFSLDGGGRWMKWTHGVPTVPVMDLVIHPRDHDLVIATHGRALYVIDDIRPLRTMSEKTLAEPLHFYEGGEVQQHWRGPEPGGFALGSSEYRGENEPYGAILTYSLNVPGLPLPDPEDERARKLEERQARRKEPEEEPRTARELAAQEQTGPGHPEARTGVAGQEEGPEEKKKKPEDKTKPEVEIRITDASGKTVRTFKAPARKGVNRVVWNFNRDGFKPFPSEREPEPYPEGPELRPGTYGVTVKYGEREAKGTVKVAQDPRFQLTEADWDQREEGIQRVTALMNAMAEAVERVRNARSDVNALMAKLPKKEGDAAKPDPLAEAGGKLTEGLTQLERKLWVPYDVKAAIYPETDVLSKTFYALFYVLGSWNPPSPTHLEYLRQAEANVNAALADVNKFFETDVAAFRKQVDEAKLRLLPEMERLEVKKP